MLIFYFLRNISYSIGNRVWFDTNDDGKINFNEGFGEEGIGTVSLSLFADDNSDGQPDNLNNPLATTATDAQGYYRFDNLTSGNYLVRVNPVNFADGGILAGYKNTAGNADSNVDSDDTHGGENGIEPNGNANSIETAGILSNTISISDGVKEPTGETDTALTDAGKFDGLTNLTVDFGFYQLGINGTIWNDGGSGTNSNNGILNADEIGVGNIRVRLFYENGLEVPVGTDGILGTSDDAVGTNANSGGILTNPSGNYTFKGLIANNYLIKVYRAGIASSTVFYNNPNDNVDSDNNGRIGTENDSDFIISSMFAAVSGDHGLQDNTIVNNSYASTQNPTVDFGLFFSPTAASVSLGGKVMSAGGQGIDQTVIMLTDNNGNIRQTITNTLGYYNFSEVKAGETYVISISHRRYSFSPNSQIISLTENATNINFTASY